MREFGNPSPYSAVRFLNELIADLHRSHPRSSVPPKHPNLAHSVSYIVTSTSWTALRVGKWQTKSRDEISAGTDDSLMDYDHRWDSSPRVRRIARLLPRPVAKRLRNAVLRVTQSNDVRALYRRDSKPRR
jgi:hypothetical protein